MRYLDAEDKSKAELKVPLDQASLIKAKTQVATTAAKIRDRRFKDGPGAPKNGTHRCSNCDFVGFCGVKEAVTYKKKNPKAW